MNLKQGQEVRDAQDPNRIGIVVGTGSSLGARVLWCWDESLTWTSERPVVLPAHTTTDVLTDPQPGIARRLSVDVRGDFRLADASKWRARLTRADLKDSALGRALFSFSSASTSNADQIAKTIAWLDDNPGHPFIVRICDTVRISDAPPPAA